jgi:CheY-like chemotaxis protein/Tfp pilus assembly protein PilF
MKHSHVHVAAREQFRILVADDTPAIRSVFQSFPTSEVLVKGIVADRPGLLHAMAKWSDIDAILCADHLAGTSGGVLALKDLRARGALPHGTAFILMSGDARKSNLMANIEARPDGILLKPFAPSMLIAKLESVVTARRALAPLRELAAQQNWVEVQRRAAEMLAAGTRFPAAVDKLQMEAAAHLANPAALRDTYRQQLVKAPNSPAMLEALARLAYRLEDYAEAEHALARLVELQPANMQTIDLMVDVLLANSDHVGAQRYLQRALRQAPLSVERQRLLGHLAILTGDTLTAQRAYLAAMRQQAEAGGLDEIDVVNAVRAQLLHGDSVSAWHVVGDARKVLPDSLTLDILQQLVEAVMYRTHEAFSKTQQRLADAIALLNRPIVKNVGSLALAAIEACLMTVLVHRAYVMSKELVSTVADQQLHWLQIQWAHKLKKWAIDAEGDELPKGMQHYHKFMR